ncbi:MAG: hypothetical protein ACO4AI_14860 [Prochlorothrix sp.]
MAGLRGCLVDFVADRGVTDAMETVQGDRLLRLIHEPEVWAVTQTNL